ncbi:MAG: 50S ribosomal protein L24 [Bacteroidia bacterium]|nr:50S ribosomal protein L24 [Bacteroidia bacterium]
MHIKRGDTVRVLSGKDRGKTGKVQVIVSSKDARTGVVQRKAIVEGVNMVSKHKRPDTKNPQGGIIETEAPVHVSNLMLLVGGKPTRVGRKPNENGKGWVRYSKKTGEIIK